MRTTYILYIEILSQNSFRATRHTLHSNAMQRVHTYTHTGGWPGETPMLELLGSSSRPLTVPMNQRPSKASRRVRTTLRDHATLGIEGVPTLYLSPSAAWDSLYEVLSMVCQGGDASRMTNVPTSLSHLSAFPTMDTFTPCTLARWYARCAREGGVTDGEVCLCRLSSWFSVVRGLYAVRLAAFSVLGVGCLVALIFLFSASFPGVLETNVPAGPLVVLGFAQGLCLSSHFAWFLDVLCFLKGLTLLMKHTIWECRCADDVYGRETSIPRPLKYIPLSSVLFVLVESEVSYAS